MEYILMPKRQVRDKGLRARHKTRANDFLRLFQSASSTGPKLTMGLRQLTDAFSPVALDLPQALSGVVIDVVDSIHEDGPKLVEASEEAARIIPELQNELELLRIHYYKPSVAPQLTPTNAPPGPAVRLRLNCAQTGHPIGGARVTVFGDFANSVGAVGETDAAGTVFLPLGAVERIYVRPPASGGFWGLYMQHLTLKDNDTVSLAPVNLGAADGLDHYHHRSAAPGDGAGVGVAVIDSGVGPHPDIVVAGGSNTARGEPSTMVGDNGSGHGTHVAGIIAARGVPPSGVRGLAPDATLYSWRIYDQGNAPATNYSIIKALVYALDEGCDIINLSLGLDGSKTVIDLALTEAIDDAVDQGAVVIAAAGNEWLEPALFPARLDQVVGVTALGRKGTFPAGCYQEFEIDNRHGTDPDDFFAAFSNIGTSDQNSEIDVIAAGVGILSTAPNGGFIPMSGTSMACAAVGGMAARLLSHDRPVRDMARDASRSAAIRNLMNRSVKTLGFGYRYEGSGLIA